MEKNKIPKKELATLIVGEIIISVLVSAVYLVLGKFDFTVPLGAALGSAVTVLNFLFLTFSVNRAVDKYLEEDKLRTDDRSEEENEKFVNSHSMAVQNAVTRSFVVRTVTMLLAFLLAFLLTEWFSPLATVIPLLMLRPLLYAAEIFKKKGEKTE